MMFSSSHI